MRHRQIHVIAFQFLLLHLLLLLCSCFIDAVFANEPTYVVTSLIQREDGYNGKLQLTSGQGPYGGDIKNLNLDIVFETSKRVHVKITDADNPNRWEVPDVIVEKKEKYTQMSQNDKDYTVVVDKNPFSFSIIRQSDKSVVFNTSGIPLIFEDQFLSIGTQLPWVDERGPHLYGLAERIHALRLDPNNQVYTLFSRDHGNQVGTNLYGSHPFYMELRNGNAHGVFLLNSNALDVSLNAVNGRRSLIYKAIGGVLDFFFMMGPNPEQVVQQYQELIGTPYFPPYFALGFHQCRWGYKNISETMDVVQKYRDNEIPLDTMWNDIDYMDSFKVFTLDPVNYPVSKVREFVDKLHQNGQHYIVIVDPGVKVEQGYEPYEDGLARKVFITKSDGKTPIKNRVWPGITTFPDFMNPESVKYWIDWIQKFYDMVPIDGLWIDMNEMTGFCNGECDQGEKYTKLKFNPRNPPYIPGGEDLNDNTLYLDSITYNNTILYDTHNMYGFYETIATKIALEKIKGKRAVVISRSSFSGSGHHGSHWLGDNDSTWSSMAYSIPGILNFNMLGIPLVGADICGFNGDTNEQLCTRWMQLGAFYPFSRNHNSIGKKSQEPYIFGPKMAAISRQVLSIRYSLLPYYYTLFYHSHVNGGTVVRPLFFEYPGDTSLNNIVPFLDHQFLVGPALMVSPVISENATTVDAYFPSDTWYDYFSGKIIETRNNFVTLDAPIDKINLHVRGGYIVPTQHPALTTSDSRRNPFHLLVALDGTGTANGHLYVDDGIELDSVSGMMYSLVEFRAHNQDKTGYVNSTILKNNFVGMKQLIMDSITIYGVMDDVCSVKVDGNLIPSSKYIFDSSLHVLKIHSQTHPMDKNLQIEYSC